MYCLYVKGVGVTASFRVPETHTFHQTLPLPSRTMMIGLMGAALGLSVADAHSFVRENGIFVSVYGKSQGMMKDLWKSRRISARSISQTQREKQLYA